MSLQYIPGSPNLPADYLSRNPAACKEQSCQICKFVDTCSSSTVCTLSVSDILDGQSTMPFLSPSAWKVSQQDCPILRRVYSHLNQGTRPGTKDRTAYDVKRYLRVCTIGRNGILVVRKDMPFSMTRDLIVIPPQALSGLLSALHLRLKHPTAGQMTKLFHCYFYALNTDKEITDTTTSCPQCAAMRYFPKEIEDFTTSNKSPGLGTDFACDILNRAKQKIFLLRDAFSSYTITRLIADEKSSTLKEALLDTTSEFKSTTGCSVRVDNAGSFQSLINDKELVLKGIHLELGRPKNRNKNPIAEKAIQELERELKTEYPNGGPIGAAGLSLVTATLNARVRNRGLCAKEIVFQRDCLTGEHLNLDDNVLAADQRAKRLLNHNASAKSQAVKKQYASRSNVDNGDLIFIKSEGDKHTARDNYIVASTEKDFLYARKLVGNQLRSKLYKLKYSEVYPVPNRVSYPQIINNHIDDYSPSTSDSEEAPPHTHHAPIRPPPVPPDMSDNDDIGDVTSSDGDSHLSRDSDHNIEIALEDQNVGVQDNQNIDVQGGQDNHEQDDHNVHVQDDINVPDTQSEDDSDAPRRTLRNRQRPPHLKDYVLD